MVIDDKILETAVVKLSKEVVLTDQANNVLLELLVLQNKVAETIENIKGQLKDAMLKNPNKPSKLIGKNVTINLTESGTRYATSETATPEVMEKFTKRIVTERVDVDAKKIDAFRELNDGNLPDGIVLKARSLRVDVKVNKEK